MKGDIRVRSNEGHGSVFEFNFRANEIAASNTNDLEIDFINENYHNEDSEMIRGNYEFTKDEEQLLTPVSDNIYDKFRMIEDNFID